MPPEESAGTGAEGEAQEGLRIGDGLPVDLGTALQQVARLNRVKHWAPAIYQDVHPDGGGWGYEHDYITNFNFDGDYNGDNNRTNFAGPPKTAFVYYSTVETETHWFLGYYFFHPTDRTHKGPNDLEGVILSIRRDGSPFGVLESWLTQSHGNTPLALNPAVTGDCYHHGPIPPVRKARSVTYGWGNKPAVYVEPRGHGVKDCLAGDCGNNDGVLYVYEDGRAETPQHSPETECGYGRQPFNRTAPCGYGLIPLDGMDAGGNRGFYVLRDEIGPGRVFQERNVFRAGNARGEANPPWAWADRQWLDNPVNMFGRRVWNQFRNCNLNAGASRTYTYQPYRF